ncbi:minor tail protein [Mycobacterium phage Danforth]|nr:minor tail protein [Mycobacterium phage Danforth]
MRLRGIPPEGVPALSYVGQPTGSVIGSTERPIGKIISVPGKPGEQGEQGEQGPPGEGLRVDGTAATSSTLPPAADFPLEMWVSVDTGEFWLSDGSVWYLVDIRGEEGPQGIQGDKGDQGPQGDRGEQGIQGPPGTTTWAGITDKPATFPPSTHTHPISQVTGLQAALDTKKDADGVYGIVAYYCETENDFQGQLDTKQSQPQVQSLVDQAIADLLDGSPAALDTLQELASALGNDPNFATTVSNQIGQKADKTTTITAGTGLTGGGDLTTSRILAVSYGTTAGTACQGNDARLSNARTPTAHTHVIGDTTGLQAALDGKASTAQLPVQITQAAYDALGPGRPPRLYAIVG